jgi:hypothetical protein
MSGTAYRGPFGHMAKILGMIFIRQHIGPGKNSFFPQYGRRFKKIRLREP